MPISERRRQQLTAARLRFNAKYPDRLRAYQAKYRTTKKGIETRREYQRGETYKASHANRTRRALKTPRGRLNDRVRSAIYRNLKKKRLSSSWDEVFGYSIEGLRVHLERQFLSGMTWEDSGAWHIDHIIPVCLFSYEDENDPEFRACWALTNLRPLWAIDNIKKRAKRTHLL